MKGSFVLGCRAFVSKVCTRSGRCSDVDKSWLDEVGLLLKGMFLSGASISTGSPCGVVVVAVLVSVVEVVVVGVVASVVAFERVLFLDFFLAMMGVRMCERVC